MKLLSLFLPVALFAQVGGSIFSPSAGGTTNGSGITVYSGPSVTLLGTQYFPIGGGASNSGTETNVEVESPNAATVTNFYVQLNAALGLGNSAVFTWRKNAVNTTVTCTISGASATTCNDTTHSFSAAQADLLDIQVVTTGTPSAGTLVMATQFGVNGTTNQNIRAVSFIFDGAGSALSGTLSRCQQVNYSGTIQEATLIADQSGSVTVDVRTVAFGSYTGPGSASTITASDTPALSSAVRYQDSTLTGWTTSLSANTVVCFVMSSPSTVTWVAGNIKIAAN